MDRLYAPPDYKVKQNIEDDYKLYVNCGYWWKYTFKYIDINTINTPNLCENLDEMDKITQIISTYNYCDPVELIPITDGGDKYILINGYDIYRVVKNMGYTNIPAIIGERIYLCPVPDDEIPTMDDKIMLRSLSLFLNINGYFTTLIDRYCIVFADNKKIILSVDGGQILMNNVGKTHVVNSSYDILAHIE